MLLCIKINGDVERTTDGAGRVDEMTLSEIKVLSACYGRPEYSAERVPSLRDLLKILPEETGLLLEIKSDRFFEEEIVKRFLSEIAPVKDRVAVVSFSGARIREIKKLDPDIPTGVITYKAWKLSHIWPNKEFDMLGPAWFLLLINPLFCWIARRRGQVVCPLDPTPDSRLRMYKLLKCDAVLSNEPGKTLKKLSQSR